MKQKRLYDRPLMQVVEVNKRVNLLLTSGGMEDYVLQEEQEW